MSIFVNNDVASGNVIFASDHNEQGARLAAVINGGLDDDNISSFSASKITNIGDWQSWVPIYANLTVGNGTVVSKFMQIGKLIGVRFQFTFGSTSSIDTIATPSVSLPVTISADYVAEQSLGLADFLTGGYIGRAVYGGSNNFNFYTFATPNASNPVNLKSASGNKITATAPFTFAAGDNILTTFFYEAA